tara:strand:- start:4064 stop:4843 length:780 start_codon:yes stop_codon:yes gene_type:complete
MDLGISGKNALVCAASRGLGKACAFSLAREGANVTITGRNADTLEATAEEIRAATGVDVVTALGDIGTPEGREAALSSCGDLDILVNNAGGPPPGNFRDFTRDDWIKALDANMLTAIDLIKSTVDGMIERKWGRIVNITSGSVKAPIPILVLSNGARTGLTGAVGTIAREVAQHNVTINNLLPGPFATDRLMNTMAAAAKEKGVSVEEMAEERAKETPAGRFGEAAEFGEACAFLCADQAGYITAQSLLLDGGLNPALF